jgi:MFS family permease
MAQGILSAVAPVAALLLSVSLLLTGSGLQGTLLPVRARIEAFSTIDIGVMGSTYFLGFTAGCVLGAYVIRRVGHIRAFTAMVSIAASVALVHALILKPAVWWPLRAVTGFCFAALYMVIESWLNERSTNENRGTIFSIYSIISLTVVSIGQLMIMLHDPAAFPLYCMVAILISLAAVPVALTAARAPAPIDTVRIRLKWLYKNSPVGFAGCLVVGLANGSFWSLGPVFAQQTGTGVSGVALFMSITVIAGALGQAPLGFASDRMDRRKVIVFTCTAASVAGIGLAILSPLWVRGVFVFAFLFGAFGFPLYALCVAHTNDHIPPDAYTESASGLLLIYGVGAIIGPMLASAVMHMVGKEGLFGFLALTHAAMAAFAVYRIWRRAPAPEEDRTVFAEAILTAQTVSPLELGEDIKQGEDPLS